MPDRFQLRGGTAADWTAANPVLASREPGAETDTGKLKIGDGSTAWSSLPYVGGGGEAAGSYVYATAMQINARTGATYTPVSADAGKLITLDNATAVTVTLPADSAATLPIGTILNFLGIGAGIVKYTNGTGATVNGGTGATLESRATWSAMSAIKIAANSWALMGDLA